MKVILLIAIAAAFNACSSVKDVSGVNVKQSLLKEHSNCFKQTKTQAEKTIEM